MCTQASVRGGRPSAKYPSGSVVRLTPAKGKACAQDRECNLGAEVCDGGVCVNPIRTIDLRVTLREAVEATEVCLGTCDGPDAYQMSH